MQVIHDVWNYKAARPSVCAIGTFDGVHLGHQYLIRQVMEDAAQRAAQSVVITFHPHPRAALGRGDVPYLTLPDEKAEAMEALGVDVLLVMAFDARTAAISADEMVNWLCADLKMASLWAGADFAMGSKRQGDIAFLTARGAERGFAVNVVVPVQDARRIISSTRIRAELALGDVAAVGEALGRPFSVKGVVAAPRAVRVPPEHALPAPGVYPVFVCGAINSARIIPNSAVIQLANPVEDCAQVAVEFV
ncbi:MAG TPA: adenylyltransferase/cytidyltransferase family protein [Thermoflexales bacterium]|nr:adenylyltransferase/cytidyltransferase family protein [Thermoflexales bacterium]